MEQAIEVKRFGDHKNALGFLRLLFASLVILSHTPEFADGDRSRELLTRAFGTISFGELGVAGFFVVSGYLISGSFLKTPDPRVYLTKRVARIYPAFIAASLVSIFLAAPLGGSSLHQIAASLVGNVKNLVFLQPPYVAGVFEGSFYATLNRAMWTIAYEFRCYLLVLALGLLGAFRRPWLIALLAALCFIGGQLISPEGWHLSIERLPAWDLWFGHGDRTLRLTAIFLVGSLFYLLEDRIRATPLSMAIAGAVLFVAMFWSVSAEPALAILGGYLLFAFSRSTGKGVFARINNKNDISYGVYLYAWPIGKLILWYFPYVSIWLIALATLAIASLCGWLSWHILEKPVMEIVTTRLRRPKSIG